MSINHSESGTCWCITTDRNPGAEKHKFVDRESFLVFAFSLALFITGTCGMIGTDEYVSRTPWPLL